ncbi:4-hydroxyphenylacetate decarboxylase activating enzyme [Anaerotignum neopropionicum]|uniref:4-hydroxyphenylacetate decarboxylase activating enzyme n=1 Tax=Anaerotignum neopropionicum TaxID=36847 RepID=A0A136WD59_9FIRM|nr:glycyl-radical enzyme activating protein [Anaerotignum neopropionicum]KXL52424.1 4-hydroxyphenylacetate decarboxylase activating enzyme [Anaerotignum neopropionicum]
MGECSNKGIVIQLQDYSIHDGDGVRTTIFLAGCKLRCQWCANPESWTTKSKLVFYRHKCIGCMKCAQACPVNLVPCKMDRHNDIFTACGKCVEVCTQKALDIACSEKSADDLVHKIERDALFFRYSGGGVTFSGGEPFLQHKFLRVLLDRFEELGVNSWVETCGYFNFEVVQDLIPKFDHIFLDIKHMDSEKHKEFTGHSNELILENAKKIYAAGVPMTIRIPTIVEVNLADENLEKTAQFIRNNLPLATIELLPYHELGKAKYISLGIEDKFIKFTTPTEDQISHAYDIFKSYGIEVTEYR